MNYIRKKQLYKAARKTWGVDMQIILAIEELAELQKALTKYLRYRTNPQITNIAEEFADVEIMMEQLKLIFNFSNNVTGNKRDKLKRLEKILFGDLQHCTNVTERNNHEK